MVKIKKRRVNCRAARRPAGKKERLDEREEVEVEVWGRARRVW